MSLNGYASKLVLTMLVLVNLLGRMSPAIALDVPKVAIHPALPSVFSELEDALVDLLYSTDPGTKAACRPCRTEDFVIHLGSNGASSVVHGSGWNTYIGPAPSPITPSDDLNPFGAAFAAIIAARELFVHEYAPFKTTYNFNSLYWREGLISPLEISHLAKDFFGEIWTVGVGSVGTAALYFLSLFTQNFAATLMDMDVVKIENLDRSPIFTALDVGLSKVEATKRFLQKVGIKEVKVDQQPLHESKLWHTRSSGTPDILISAANEFNVRYHIESGYPPVQIYGTTGENWQASLIRHIPLKEACSFCVFPEQTLSAPPMKCANAPIVVDETNEKVDAALPFLSFAAGLMAAAEVVKLRLEEFPFSHNKVLFNTHPNVNIRLSQHSISHRNGCLCGERSLNVHQAMLKGTRYANLSKMESNFSYKKVS
jgi:molybdopterin/thiamine biosynthesis adenylyltransferase